jgi:hypothetical protein
MQKSTVKGTDMALCWRGCLWACSGATFTPLSSSYFGPGCLWACPRGDPIVYLALSAHSAYSFSISCPHRLSLSTLTSLTGVAVDIPRTVTILFVAIVAVVGILLTSVGARPNLLHLPQSLQLLRVLLLRLLQLPPLAILQDLFSPYLQLTLRQLSTRSSLVSVMHLLLSSPFCQVNLSLGFLTPPAAIIWRHMPPHLPLLPLHHIHL